MQILIANGYDLNESDNHGKTPLLFALEAKNMECLQVLLQHTANVTEEHLTLAHSFKTSFTYEIVLVKNNILF